MYVYVKNFKSLVRVSWMVERGCVDEEWGNEECGKREGRKGRRNEGSRDGEETDGGKHKNKYKAL